MHMAPLSVTSRVHQVIAAAAAADARSIALMPCCYQASAAQHAPEALRAALGVPLAADIHRTYELEQRGYALIRQPRVLCKPNADRASRSNPTRVCRSALRPQVSK